MILDKLLNDWNNLSNPDKIKYIFDYCDNCLLEDDDILKWRNVFNSPDLDIKYPGLKIAFQSCKSVTKDKEPTKTESRHWQSHKDKYALLEEEKVKFSDSERALNIFTQKMRESKLNQII